MERAVRTPDGRMLAVQESGDPAGRPVLVHMGTPGPRGLYGPHVRDAAARGLRLISYDRPGYGGSSPQPGRTVADCAADVRTICAELGIDRLATWGISGGGPHVLACAALSGTAMPPRDAKRAIDWKALSERIGHSDVAFTMRQYVQTDLEVQRRVATTLAELIIGGALPGALTGESVHKSVHTLEQTNPGADAPGP